MQFSYKTILSNKDTCLIEITITFYFLGAGAVTINEHRFPAIRYNLRYAWFSLLSGLGSSSTLYSSFIMLYDYAIE
jgi:hypothetical protein